MLNGKSLLITGGKGSFGREAIKTVLSDYPGVARVVVCARDEFKQFEMQQDPELQALDGVDRVRQTCVDV